MIERKKIQPDTIIRLICLFIVMANQVFVSIGRNPIPFSESQIYETLSLIATIFMSLWAAWKNNSITNEAIIADEIMHDLKEKRKSDSEVH